MYDTIIIGAGPAGLMAGITSKKNNLILEKNKSAGKKLLITGGGRCNITNNKSNKEFLDNIDNNKKFLYSTINNFGPKDIIYFFEKNNVLLKEENDNKVFPLSNKSFSILEVLLNNCKAKINYNEEVKSITREDNFFIVKSNKESYKSKKILIATGGSSFSNTGSNGDNMKFAKTLNQPVINIYPAELGINLKEKLNLSGTSVKNVSVKVNKIVKSGNLIFTHSGFGGESIMNISEYIYKDNLSEIEIDFLPELTIENLTQEILNYSRDKEFHSFIEQYFSKKLTNYFLDLFGIKREIKIKQMSKKDIEKFLNIKNIKYDIKNKNNIELAYVTGGGIDMKYINSRTMESTKIKNLFFAGEALDIHGPVGGYNLTLALSTGYTAGLNL